jgi:glutamine synthetase
VARVVGTEARLVAAVDDLREAGVRYVSGSLVDTGSINRLKSVPLDKLASLATTGIGFSYCWATALTNDHFTTTDVLGGPSGDMRMVADLDSLVQTGATPEWAWAALDQYLQDGSVAPWCQRSFVKRMVAQAAERGYALQMTYEFEWFVGKVEADGMLGPCHLGPGYSSNAWALVHPYALDLLDALAAQDVSVECFHPEYSFGQMEVSTAPVDPVRAADGHVLFRHTARTVAARHGYRCSFSPVVLPSGLGNGCHLHFSLWNKAGDNLFAGGNSVAELTGEGESFLAGVLADLPALTALACATTPSYERLKPQHWSGAYACWGQENREAALRFIPGAAGARGQTANMEFKAVDGSGHPYLVVGAVIAAGLHGLEQGLHLPRPVAVDPHDMSLEERAAEGIKQLPSSLGEAAEALASSAVLRAAMGDVLFDAMVAVRRAEAEADAGRPLDELVAEQLWRF